MRGADRLIWSPPAAASPEGMVLARGRDAGGPMVPAQRATPPERDFHTQGVHKLDSAMSVLTTLLVDLEHELRDHSATVAEIDGVRPELSREERRRAGAAQRDGPAAVAGHTVGGGGGPGAASPEPSPPGSSTPGYHAGAAHARADKLDPALGAPANACADKLESALSVLTRQLAELERELRGHNPQGNEHLAGAHCNAVGARHAAAGAAEAVARQHAGAAGTAHALDCDLGVEAELDAVQAKVSALRQSLGAAQQEECLIRGSLAQRLDEADSGQLPDELPDRPSAGSSAQVAAPPGGQQAPLPPPAASPALSTCSVASLAKLQLEGGPERLQAPPERPQAPPERLAPAAGTSCGSALASMATQQARAAPAARRGSMSPQPAGASPQRNGPGVAPGTTGSIGGVAPRRGPQTPLRAARDTRSPPPPHAGIQGVSASVDVLGFVVGGAAPSGGGRVGRGRKPSSADLEGGAGAQPGGAGSADAVVHAHSFQGTVTPMNPANMGRGTSALIPATSPKSQYRAASGQVTHSHGPRLSLQEAQRATSPVQAGSSAMGRASPRQQSCYQMPRSTTPQGGMTPRTAAATAARAAAQRSQSPARRRAAAPGTGSPAYPPGSAVPLRLNSAPHGSATPTVNMSPWQTMSHSPLRRNSMTRGSASIPVASSAPPPTSAAVLPPPSETGLERVPSRSFSSMDLSTPGIPTSNSGLIPSSAPQAHASGVPSALGTTGSLGAVPAASSGPAPAAPGAAGASARSFGTAGATGPAALAAHGNPGLAPPPGGASVSVGPLVPGKSFAATSQAPVPPPPAQPAPPPPPPPPGAPMPFGVPGQSQAHPGTAAKTPAPPMGGAAPAPLTGSPQGGQPGGASRSLAARSPSRTRSVNPGVVQHNVYSSPFAVRKPEGVLNMFSPQVPAPPPVFAMQRCSTSMTSSNASFYFAPQHTMAGPGNQPPVPASSYVADASDPIDLMLTVGLSTLDRGTSSKLMLRRLAMGRYEIDGRRVSLRWTDQGGNPGLLVGEDEVADKGSEMPLLAYLSQAANVAASLSGGRADMPKIARIPKEQRLTFAEEVTESTSTLDVERVGNERCESMRIACEQARLREQAAEAYESGMFAQFPPRSLPPPPGLPLPYLN